MSIPQPGLHVERMQLDLIDGRHDIGVCDEIGELLLIEVADTDGAHATIGKQLL